MPEVHVLVRDLDAAVVERLKARARAHGRSLEAELKRILEDAARPGPPPPLARAESADLVDRVRALFGDRPHTDGAARVAEGPER